MSYGIRKHTAKLHENVAKQSYESTARILFEIVKIMGTGSFVY